MKKIFLWGFCLTGFFGLFTLLFLLTPDSDPQLMLEKYSSKSSQFFELPSGEHIHFRDEGKRNGQVLILIHGANSSLHTWEKMVDKMKTDFRLVSLDLPGHSLTGPNKSGDYSAAVLTDAVINLMDHLDIRKGIWVGNSMGGWLTWRSALSHPKRQSGLILIDPSGAPRDEPAKLYLGARLLQTKMGQWVVPKITPRSMIEGSVKANYFNTDLVTDEIVDRYWELLRLPGNRRAAADRAKVNRNLEYWKYISNINVPVLVLWGQEDSVSPSTLATKYKVQLIDCEIITYPGVGHLPMEEASDLVARDISDWISANFQDPRN